MRFLQTRSREKQKSLGEKKKGLGKKISNFLVILAVCLSFLMSEFNHDLEVFHQKLVQTKQVPVLATNSGRNKTRHNSTPDTHPQSSSLQISLLGPEIMCLKFWNLCKIRHLRRIGQQVFSEMLNRKFKSRKVNSWSHQKCCHMTSNAKFKCPYSP